VAWSYFNLKECTSNNAEDEDMGRVRGCRMEDMADVSYENCETRVIVIIAGN